MTVFFFFFALTFTTIITMVFKTQHSTAHNSVFDGFVEKKTEHTYFEISMHVESLFDLSFTNNEKNNNNFCFVLNPGITPLVHELKQVT